MSMDTSRSNNEGLKLREEKHFNDFYPDLKEDVSLPIIITNESITDDLIEPTPVRKQHVKQLIYDGHITVEPLQSAGKTAEFHKCSIPINRLDSMKGRNSSDIPILLQPSYHHKKIKDPNEQFSGEKSPYITKYQQCKRPFLEEQLKTLASLRRISSNLKNIRPEYDMDEQDELYRQFLNETYLLKSQLKISHELFELIISVLETEWFHLESHIPRLSYTDPNSTITTRLQYELYGSDDGTCVSTDQPCAICYGTESDDTNAIVFCEGCDIAVHQECYGIVFIPVGPWLCRRCHLATNYKINCLVCPSDTGAFKQTDTGVWIHSICALWIPELYFANLHYMEPIEGVANISKSRWKLVCYICKRKMGACIQCTHRNCFVAYHVTCARRAGLYLKWDKDLTVGAVASNQVHLGNKLHSFCDKHSPIDHNNPAQGILKARRFFNNKKNSYSDESAQNSITHHPTPINERNWTTTIGTPIAPQKFANIIDKILRLFNIQESTILSNNFCKYWSMKREFKKGMPLINKPVITQLNSLTSKEIDERTKFIKILLNDLQRVKVLGGLVSKRTDASIQIENSKHEIKSILQDPEKAFMKITIIDPITETEFYKS